MNLALKVLFVVSTLWIAWMWYATDQALAQSGDQFGAQCRSGASIVSCQTFNCPKGDTNDDGTCNLADQNAELEDARNDGLCANPTSGCGEVLYFSAGTNPACGARVKENSQQTCDLYNAANPVFTPVPEPASSSMPEPTEAPEEQDTPETLPETGSEILVGLGLMAVAITGAVVYDKTTSIS